jgi:hydrogenase expression/formation protein HypC
MIGSPLPVPEPPAPVNEGEHCSVDDGCITCGDVAVPLTVVEARGSDARCRDDRGREELVAVELVGAVQPGQRLLVHAGVAIERMHDEVR